MKDNREIGYAVSRNRFEVGDFKTRSEFENMTSNKLRIPAGLIGRFAYAKEIPPMFVYEVYADVNPLFDSNESVQYEIIKVEPIEITDEIKFNHKTVFLKNMIRSMSGNIEDVNRRLKEHQDVKLKHENEIAALEKELAALGTVE